MQTSILYTCICLWNSLQFPIFLLKWCLSNHEDRFTVFKEDLNQTNPVLTFSAHEVTKYLECCLTFFVSGSFTTIYLVMKTYNDDNFEILEECNELDWKNIDHVIIWKMTLSKICLFVYIYLFNTVFLYITLCGEWNFVSKIWITEQEIKCLSMAKVIIMGIWLNTLNPRMKRCWLFLIVAISLSLWYEINILKIYEIPFRMLLYKILVWISETLLIFGGQGDECTTFMTFLHSSLIFVSITTLIIQCIVF
jgi:hypothetical protein